MDKIFISASELLRDSFELGQRVFESDFEPTFIIGVWRGGAPVGIAVQEILERLGCEADHYAIRTSSYGNATESSGTVKIFGLRHVVDVINADDNLLIIDDVFDSGRSVAAIIKELTKLCRLNTPKDIRVATVYYKPEKNKTDRTPDFFIHETEKWLIFPHELHGCTADELRQNKNLPARFFAALDMQKAAS